MSESKKRGRPISSSSQDFAQQRARELARARKQKQRSKNKTNTQLPHISEAQESQSSQVAQHSTLFGPSATPIEIGLRVTNLNIATDLHIEATTNLVPSQYNISPLQLSTYNASPQAECPTLDGIQFLENEDTPLPSTLPTNKTLIDTQPLDIRYEGPTQRRPIRILSTPPSDLPQATAKVRYRSVTPSTEASFRTAEQVEDAEREDTRDAVLDIDFDSDTSDEPDYTALTAAKLFHQLSLGFHGCTEEKHDHDFIQHLNSIESSAQRCSTLRQVSSDSTFPSVLSNPALLSSVEYQQMAQPSIDAWDKMYYGYSTSQPSGTPMHVCLHQEEAGTDTATVAFDVDSYMGFALNLAFAKQGIQIQPAPQYQQNLQSDVHIQMHHTEYGEDEHGPTSIQTPSQLRNIPHFHLGRVDGANDIAVYVLFPELEVLGPQFTGLTRVQYSAFWDLCLWPSIYKYYDAHYLQHLPASFDHTDLNSRARQLEQRLASGQSYQSKQAISYHLTPGTLEQVWTTVQERIEAVPAAYQFSGAQLFFTAKGVKLRYKSDTSRPTLYATLENFVAHLEIVVNMEHVDVRRFWIDVGKETCSPVSAVQNPISSTDDTSHVFLWKRCCLNSYTEWVYGDETDPPSEKTSARKFYSVSMLYDAANLTCVVPKRSTLYQGGLIYSQFYGSVKEVIDASKTYPFQNDGLEELALDPLIRKAAQNVAKTSKRDAHVIERAYSSSKKRLVTALKASEHKSFGLREEHRCSWVLIQHLLSLLQQAQEIDEVSSSDDAGLLTTSPAYAWTIPTNVYLNYLYRNADKFATGFELVRASGPGDEITWDQTKVMAMFLRCLRYCLAGHDLPREYAIWKSTGTVRRLNRPVQRHGLGFENTLLQFGYCWLEPRLDWAQFRFQPQFSDTILFGNLALQQAYLKRGGAVADFFDIKQQLDFALENMQQHVDNPSIRPILLEWMVHLVLKQFRCDVIKSVERDLKPGKRRAALRGPTPFSFAYIDSITQPDKINLVVRRKAKTITQLFLYLFNEKDEMKRAHWSDSPYRLLYHRCLKKLATIPNTYPLERAFAKVFHIALLLYHRLLPYPHPYGLTETNKKGRRQWYSLGLKEGSQPDVAQLEVEDFVQLDGAYDDSVVPDLPTFVTWDKEQWKSWIQDCVQSQAHNPARGPSILLRTRPTDVT